MEKIVVFVKTQLINKLSFTSWMLLIISLFLITGVLKNFGEIEPTVRSLIIIAYIVMFISSLWCDFKKYVS